jgi:peptidyl-prolyl cis-trans isomerase SurA
LKVKFLLAALATFFSIGIATAQKVGVLDEIIAVVGENYILRSDLEAEYFQMKTQYEEVQKNLRCDLMEQLLMQQLMLHKADVDSTYIDQEMIEAELERRLRFYASQIGGEKKLEKYLGKSIAEYKEVIRPTLEKQMRIQEVQSAMIRDIKVSPTEVRKFFEEIPKDSLPVFDSEVEVGQILISPKPSKYAKEYAYSSLEKLRKEIISGKRDFAVTASSYSDDIGSKTKGGDLGYFERGQMVPEFEAMAYKLKGDSISDIIETDFGYHILQLMDRKGDRLNVRHILIKPKIIDTDITGTKDFLREIANKIKGDTITFCDAAAKYSEDEMTKSSCGMFTNSALGNNRLEISELEADIALIVQKLEPGQISSPMEVYNPDGSTSFRLIYLKSEVEPHVASLKIDYQKIQAFATEKKKAEEMQLWAKKYRKNSYVWIDEDFTECPSIKEWNNNPK